MKRFYIIAFAMLMAGTVTTSAQLKVDIDGTVKAGSPIADSDSHISLSSYSTSSVSTKTKIVGLYGRAEVSGRVGISCGVRGRAHNDLAGMNYGVVGEITAQGGMSVDSPYAA